PLPQRHFREGVPISSILDLRPGDYVVHIQYGIGVYRGLTRRKVEGAEKEFLQIAYKHPDQLLLPADQLDRIQKYLSPSIPQFIESQAAAGIARCERRARARPTWLASWWNCTPGEPRRRARPTDQTRLGRARWRPPFPTSRLQAN
ncbi:MAG: hypothetical protein C4340_07740, partial [Armatimonadota bacterium]